MSDAEFDERLERVRKASEVIGSLPTEALQTDAFHYLIGNPTNRRAAEQASSRETPIEPSATSGGDSGTGSVPAAANGKKTPARKGKPSSVNPDKALELAPTGKQSFAEFVAEKKPVSHIEKYTACIYWILVVAEYPKATIAQIVTCYHAEKWTLPTDVRNTASQAGKKELDNTSGMDDIKLSNLGRNLIQGLPKAEKK